MFFAAPPKNQFVPEDAARGSTPESDEKARFTTLETGDSAGDMVPSFHIIKCSTAKDEPDLTRTRVVQNMHTQPGFTAADGYSL